MASVSERGICDKMNNRRESMSSGPSMIGGGLNLSAGDNVLRNKIVTLGAVLLTTLALPGPVSAAVDAESVVTGKCTACHSAERIRESAMTEDEWTDLVDEEIDRGAQLDRAERAAVIDWLAENYGASGSEVVETVETEEEAAETTEVFRHTLSLTGASYGLIFSRPPWSPRNRECI